VEKEKHILVQDNDCHWFVIPDAQRKDWDEWCSIDSDDPKSWNVPDYAKEVGGSPSRVKFTGYEME